MRKFAKKVSCINAGKTYLYYVGQAGFILKSSSGQLLGIDLYLSDCVERIEGHMGFKRLLPKILSPYDLEFDAIIATHAHFDHFDFDSIPELMANNHTQLFASAGCEKEAARLYMKKDRITYVKAGNQFHVGNYALEFVACDHGEAAPDAVGVVITVDGKRIYMTGDTCLRLDRVKEITDIGSIDVLLAPINGAFGNMNEAECAELSAALKPDLTIPFHYGMFASHGGDPGKFADIMNEQYPGQRYILMTLGEGMVL